MRELLAARADGDEPARLAFDVYIHRLRSQIGAMLGALGGLDAVVFTGGVGSHQPEIRARIAGGFQWCGLAIDARRNAAALGREGVISDPGSTLRALVVLADEERMIAHETAVCLARATAPRNRP
jgi:acetate kinase